jgi:hypothetical protein
MTIDNVPRDSIGLRRPARQLGGMTDPERLVQSDVPARLRAHACTQLSQRHIV